MKKTKKPSVPRQPAVTVQPRTSKLKDSITRQVIAGSGTFDVHLINKKNRVIAASPPQKQLRARVVAPPPPQKKSIVSSVPKKPSKSKIIPRKVSNTAKKPSPFFHRVEQEN